MIHLEGEFAFILWDSEKQAAFCARDHMGLRPLFYRWTGNRLIVASDITGVLAALPAQPDINAGLLAEIMTFEFVTHGETVWEGVKRLPPAHSLHLREDSIEERRYWSIPQDARIKYGDTGEYIEHYRAMFASCVKRATRTDHMLAVECSGGLDSSAVFAIASGLQESGGLHAPDLQAYTYAPPPGSDADEREYAWAMADHLGRRFTEAPLFMPDADWFNQRARKDRDVAPYANSVMAITLGETLVSDGCRASLNGQGGDHFLDGSKFYYWETLSRGQFRRFASNILTDLKELGPKRTFEALTRAGISPTLPDRLVETAKKIAGRNDESVAERVEKYNWLSQQSKSLLCERIEAAKPSGRYHTRYKQLKVSHPLTAYLLDNMSRQNARIGFEARTPMMSREFIEFFAATPEWLRNPGATRKWIHRQAMADQMPAKVLDRTDKAEFSQIYEPLWPTVRVTLETAVSADINSIVNTDETGKLYGNFCTAAIDYVHTWTLWGTYSVIEFATNNANKDLKD